MDIRSYVGGSHLSVPGPPDHRSSRFSDCKLGGKHGTAPAKGGHVLGELLPGAGTSVIRALLATSRTDSALLFPTVPPEDTRIDGGPVILLQAGTPHNLTCRAFNAKPAATIIWFRDGTQQEGAVASTVRPHCPPAPRRPPSRPPFLSHMDLTTDGGTQMGKGALEVMWSNPLIK